MSILPTFFSGIYQPHTPSIHLYPWSLQDYLPHMSLSEAREYMKALFLALRNVHSYHIIHRDVKPSNFLYNRTAKQ